MTKLLHIPSSSSGGGGGGGGGVVTNTLTTTDGTPTTILTIPLDPGFGKTYNIQPSDIKVIGRRTDDRPTDSISNVPVAGVALEPLGLLVGTAVDVAAIVDSQLAGAPVQPQLPITIASGVNDQFQWIGEAGGAGPVAFTIAPDTYTTIADMAAAMEAAVDGDSNPFSASATVTDDGNAGVVITAVADIGPEGNSDLLLAADTNDAFLTIFGASTSLLRLDLGASANTYSFMINTGDGVEMTPIGFIGEAVGMLAVIKNAVGGFVGLALLQVSGSDLLVVVAGLPGTTINWAAKAGTLQAA